MPGRKPTPTALRVLRGNPQRRPMPTREATPTVPERLPRAPKHLSKVAAAEWRRVGKLLLEAKLLTELDLQLLAGYCAAYSQWVDAEESVAKFGSVVMSPNGFPVMSPHLAIANRALELMRKFAVEFGMSPSSRSKAATSKTKAGEADDEWGAVDAGAG